MKKWLMICALVLTAAAAFGVQEMEKHAVSAQTDGGTLLEQPRQTIEDMPVPLAALSTVNAGNSFGSTEYSSDKNGGKHQSLLPRFCIRSISDRLIFNSSKLKGSVSTAQLPRLLSSDRYVYELRRILI